MIDGYSRQARLVPVLIAALPLVLLGAVALPRLAAIDRVMAVVLLLALLPCSTSSPGPAAGDVSPGCSTPGAAGPPRSCCGGAVR